MKKIIHCLNKEQNSKIYCHLQNDDEHLFHLILTVIHSTNVGYILYYVVHNESSSLRLGCFAQIQM